VQDVKVARQLASEITQSGAKLYDLMENETTERQERSRALRFLDQAATTAGSFTFWFPLLISLIASPVLLEGSKEQQFVERKIREIIENTKQAVEDMRKECEELEADQRNLESKITKKQEELERTEKRLKSLENVRPQFMEETEKLEKELQRYYEVYMEKLRNLDYLESELEKYHKAEAEQMEEQERKLKKMRERLLKEEVDLMRGGTDGGSGMNGNGGGGGLLGGGRGGRSGDEDDASEDDDRGPRNRGPKGGNGRDKDE
jgi:clusterin-associated protein 1